MERIIYFFDLFGVMAFSVTGALLAGRKKLDIFGITLISLFTALGGGTIRDVLLGNFPVFWIKNYNYIIVVLISSVITQIFYSNINKLEDILKILDAVGLAIFTVIGIKISLSFGISDFIAVIMGLITAVFGGLIRDTMCQELPLILHKEIYATASLFGGIIFLILKKFNVPLGINYFISVIFIFILRVVSIKKGLSLPRI